MNVIVIIVWVLTFTILIYTSAWGSFIMLWYCQIYRMVPLLPTPVSLGTIPRVMYKQGESAHVPPQIQKLYRKIENDNPGYHVVYFSSARRRDFIVTNLEEEFPGVTKTYDHLVPGAYKADLFRTCVLYANGGLYGDYSQQYLVALDTMVDCQVDELVLSLDAPIPLLPIPYRRGIACFLASRARNPFWRQCIQNIMKNYREKWYGASYLDPTGPGLMHDVLDKHPEIRYRMDIGVFFHGSLHDSMYFRRLGTHERVIRHKLPGHYSLMSAGEHYSSLWRRRKIYA